MRSARMRIRRPRVRRIAPFSVNRMVPNILTLLALCAGMTAIRFAVNGQFEYAVFAIIVAGIFDGLDGRLARLLKATSSFGAELDSLSDFISFGAAPAVVLYLWTMSGLQSIGWAMVLFYAVCCALRLARFNTQLAAEPPPWRSNFFSGVPAPAGAGLIMIPMFASFETGHWLARSPILNAVWIGIVALLMVSTIPTFSLKRIRIPSHYVMPTLLGVGLMAAFLTTAPWATLMVVGVVYVGSIPLTVRASRRMRRDYQTGHEQAAEPLQPAPAGPPVWSAAPAPPIESDNDPPASEWRHERHTPQEPQR
ncbi:MAG: CDP-diacylglycerol--serine O-phosphatidyltransferase [Alphaproteobacteria bacterium]